MPRDELDELSWEEMEKVKTEQFKEKIWYWFKWFLWFIFAIILLKANPLTFIGAGHRGVVTTWGKVNDKPLGEGINLVYPFADTVHSISIRMQKHSTNAQSSSKDLQNIHAEITLNFHLMPEKVVKIFQDIGELDIVGEKLINPIVQEAVKASTAHYTAEELITKRPVVRDSIKAYVTERLENYGIKVDDFSITHFDFSKTFNEAIEAKVTAEQNFLKAQRDLERVKVEAKQKIEQAHAESESLKMQKQEITPDLIKLREIEMQREAVQKWDGKMPTTIMGNAIPFINMTK